MEKFRKDRHSNGEDKFDEDRASWSNTDSYELIATLSNDTLVNKNRKAQPITNSHQFLSHPRQEGLN